MAVTATITPGVVLSENEEITISKLNSLGTPTVNIEGAVGSLALAAGSVTNTEIATSAAIQHDKLAALSTGQLIVGNAGTPTATTVSGDVTIAADGAVTIANDAVTQAKIADDAVGADQIADGAVDGAAIAMTSDAQGDILYHNGTAYARLAAGTSGQVLQTGGASADPSWVSQTTNPSVPQVDFKDSGTSGNFTVPSGVTRVKVSVQGGGGCGHTSMPSQDNFNNKGGAGGAYFEKTLTVTAGDTIAWVAAGSVNTANNPAASGESSSITYDSTTYTAGGGGGGYSTGQNVGGGTVTGSVDISVAGENNRGGGMAGSRALSSYGNGGYNSFSFEAATGQGGYVKFEY
jgi:hypothetical protein